MTDQPTEAPAVEVDTPPSCKYPGCGNPPEPKAPSTTGPAPKYCTREDHNPVSAYRAKNRKPAAGGTRPAVEEPSDKPVTDAAADAVNVREDIVKGIASLQADVARWLDLLATMTDPEAAEAQITAVTSEAATQVATAVQRADNERARAVALEQRAKDADTARSEAQDAADGAINQLDEALQKFETDLQKARDDAAGQVRLAQEEADRKVAEANRKADEAIEAARQDAADRVNKIREIADTRVIDAEQAAEEKVDAANKRVAAMEEMVEQTKTEAAKTKTDADRAVATATEETAKALKTAESARRQAEQAVHDAEVAVAAEKTLREQQTTAYDAELGRARDSAEQLLRRQTDLEGQVTALHDAVNQTKDELRDAQTKLQLANAELKRRGPGR
jgi:colicin import membrane protein